MFRIKKSKRIFIEKIIINFLNKNSSKKYKFSSCLSRSLTASLAFQLLGIKTKVHLGIIKADNKKYIPHAWLSFFDNSWQINEKINPDSKANLYYF